MSEATIVNGPSKGDIFTELWLPVNRKERHVFTLSQKTTGPASTIPVFVQIMSIEMEDGTGESWNISGYVGNSKKFTAYYRTDKRTGTYRIND